MHWIIAAALCCLVSNSVLAQGAGYSGEQTREIKSLSAQEQADFIAGRGMGMARPGELNHYPGPAHVLEWRERLGLTPQQVDAVQASFNRMTETAQPLGIALVERERTLDFAFRDGTITPDILAVQTAAVAELQGKLRAVHLNAHIEMRAILTSHQIAAYDALRGYECTASTPSGGHRKSHPG